MNALKRKAIAMLLFVVLFLAACSGGESTNEAAPAPETEPQNMKEIVHEYSVGSFEDVSATITGTELIVKDSEENETTYALPEDEFFVSIAPYINQTHPWTFHSLTGCQGELVEKEFDMYIEDEDGNIVLDETVTSLPNGFIDLWLPRDNTYQIKISHDGKTVESELSTFEDDATCITTMQLM